MLQRHKTQGEMPRQLLKPRRRDLFFHFFKTLKLIGALLLDRRVFIGRKLAFGITVLAFLAVVLFPDIELGLSFLLPVIGTILGVPLEAGVDWTLFALVIVSLLRIFPAHIVSEHYERLFTRR